MTIRDAYDEWSEQYDHDQNKTRDLDASTTIKILDRYNFSTVIELGCGTGKNTEYLLNKADQVIGIDFSEKMLKKARGKYSEDKLKLRKTDITKNWNIRQESADLITCNLVLEHIENLDPIFSKAYQTLKKDGLFFISELHPFKQYLGSKARFDVDDVTKELEAFTHHVSDFLSSAATIGFDLIELNEWFDEASKSEIPRLLVMVFRK